MNLFKLTLKKKLLFFSIILAIIPLGLAGNKLITITQDELKSAANDELSVTAGQFAGEIDALYLDTWRSPLMLIKSGIENESLDVQGKVSLLTSIKEVPDIVSIQLSVSGIPNPVLVIQDSAEAKFENAGLNPVSALMVEIPNDSKIFGAASDSVTEAEYFEKVDLWMVTLIVPLQKKIAGRDAVLAARVNLERLKQAVIDHPFNKTGLITLISAHGERLFDPAMTNLTEYRIVSKAVDVLKTSGSRPIGIEPYVRPDGKAMLGAYSFPSYFNWGVISERTEEDAYLAVSQMFNSLMLWVSLGLIVAVVGGFLLSHRISKPILEIGKVAEVVGTGNFNIKVGKINTRDEIYELGNRINNMIVGLRERFELQKFVSGSTIDAIKKAKEEGIKLGGERRNATVFFSDIRGFTAFSEKVEPEDVIEMLNTYLRCQAEIVEKHNGDIDKFVGDELVAVFHGDNMVDDAMKAAVDIHQKIKDLNENHPKWNIGVGIGINSGDMVFGAMGSEERMDFTMLGDNVNLGARLCSAAKAYQTIISVNSFEQISNPDQFILGKLEPIPVKGKVEPIKIFEVSAIKE